MSTLNIPPRHIKVLQSDSTPLSVPLSFKPEIVRRTPTSGHPPQIEITVENLGHEPWSYLTDYTRVFSGIYNTNAPPYLLLIPVDLGAEFESDKLRVVPNTLIRDAVRHESRLEAGEQERKRYNVIDSPKNGEEQYPVAEYRFKQTVETFSSDPEDSTEFEWGFSLSVSGDLPGNH